MRSWIFFKWGAPYKWYLGLMMDARETAYNSGFKHGFDGGKKASEKEMYERLEKWKTAYLDIKS